MRMLGLIGLVLVLVTFGLLAKKQMQSLAPLAVPGQPAPVAGAPLPTVRDQSQQLQQQIKQSLDAALQARPMPEEQ